MNLLLATLLIAVTGMPFVAVLVRTPAHWAERRLPTAPFASHPQRFAQMVGG